MVNGSRTTHAQSDWVTYKFDNHYTATYQNSGSTYVTANSFAKSTGLSWDHVDKPIGGLTRAYTGDEALTAYGGWPTSSTVNENRYVEFTLVPKQTVRFEYILFDVGTTSEKPVGHLKVELSKVSGGTTTSLDGEILASTGYAANKSFDFADFTATPSETIHFRFLGYNAGEASSPLYLDNVRLFGAVPEPATWGTVSGLGLIAFVAFRRWRGVV